MEKPEEIEVLYQDYLKKVGQVEALMHPEQKKQVREAFYAGVASGLLAVSDGNYAQEIIDELRRYIAIMAKHYETKINNRLFKDRLN
jgi:hypothetical protein